MRLRRIAGDDYEHQGPQQRPPPREGVRQDHREEGHAATRPQLLPDSFGAGSGKLQPARRDQGAARARCRPRSAALAARQDALAPKADPGIHQKLPGDAQDRCKRIYEHAEEHERSSSTSTSSARRTATEPRSADGRGEQERMKVAYWPGCVSRGFTPELHGSMAMVAAAARHRAGRARPRQLLRRRRDRRAQPGARRHAQRAHLRARPADRALRDDEHLLDLPGRAVRVPGAPRRRLRATARTSTRRSPPRASSYEQGGDSSNKNFLWLLVEEIRPRRARASRSSGRSTGLRVGPFYGCYIVRPDRPARLRRAPRARPLPRAGDRGARRRGRSSTTARASAAASR